MRSLLSDVGLPADAASERPAHRHDTALRADDPCQRLVARALDTIASLLPAATALAFTVDEALVISSVILRHSRQLDAAAALVRRLPQLEPIDPYSPRRAATRGATVLSPAELGGMERVAGSLYGRQLRRHGFAPPVVMYFRRDGALIAGIAVLYAVDVRPFDEAALRLLTELHPLLQDALSLEPQGPGAAAATVGDLTARELQVARRVADGDSNAAVAVALGMREATVKTHLTHIYGKLGVRTRTQLAVVLGRDG